MLQLTHTLATNEFSKLALSGIDLEQFIKTLEMQILKDIEAYPYGYLLDIMGRMLTLGHKPVALMEELNKQETFAAFPKIQTLHFLKALNNSGFDEMPHVQEKLIEKLGLSLHTFNPSSLAAMIRVLVLYEAKVPGHKNYIQKAVD